ncbi:MAG: hypothetical protein AB7U97_08480 [Pirellulales bacterium]
MNIASIALVVAAVGVNFGWQPSKEDPQAYEVLMQVEPELVGVMAEGRALPIESHVPKEVAPIRNIRVVVGDQKLPRTMIVAKAPAKSALKPTSDRIVRGQEPVEHTANFQADAWGPSSPNRQFDQRGATIGSAPAGATQSNPCTIDNAHNSRSDAGTSVKNSVNSSIDQVNQQFRQSGQDLYNKSKDAASDFGNQLQNISGFSSQPAAPAATAPTATTKSWAAPPLSGSSLSQPPTAPAGPSWSSITTDLAPPRLAPPPLANDVRLASNPTGTRTGAGPAFPPPPTTGAQEQRSLLTTPQGSNREAENDWDSVWGTQPSTTAASNDSDADGMVTVPPRMRTTAASTSPQLPAPPAVAKGTSAAPPFGDRYGNAGQTSPASNSGADAWANFGRPQDNVFNDPRMTAATPATQPPAATTPPNQSFAGQNPLTQPTIGTAPPTTQAAAMGQPGVSPEEVPWKPLLAVSLALAGSIGANFYLGMSYAETRHRYRSLVAKTTHAFEKKAGLAA